LLFAASGIVKDNRYAGKAKFHVTDASQIILDLADEAATGAFGRRLSPLLVQGDFVGLSGTLGAGKTTLARGVIEAAQARCGLRDPVTSPTYTLVQIYQAGSLFFWHFDLYRIEAEEDVRELGLDEALNEGVSLVEWPERLGSALPEDRLEIVMKETGDGRQAVLRGWGSWGARLGNGAFLTEAAHE